MKSLCTKVLLVIVIGVAGWVSAAPAVDSSSAVRAYERRDYSSAHNQFAQLAEQNDPYSQYMVGRMYAEGRGTPRDYTRAYKWLYLAEGNDVDAAGRLRRDIRTRMSRQEIADAEQLVKEWRDSRSPAKTYTEIKDAATVRQVQQALADQRFYYDRVDGILGANTRKSIRNYQRYRGMAEDGRITALLLEALNITPSYQGSGERSSAKSGPAGDESGSVAELQKKLRKIIRKAKKKRAADPWLIKSLEELAGEQERFQVVLHENFLSKNYQGGESWRIVSGKAWLEKEKGLILTPAGNWGSGTGTMDDLALSLLEVLVKQAASDKTGDRLAKIRNEIAFGSEFALRVETGSLKTTEGLIFTCMRDRQGESGYQVVFHPGERNKAKLFRISGKNATEITTRSSRVQLKGDTSHSFEWKRSANGVMQFLVDKQRMFEVKVGKDEQGFDSLGIGHVGDGVVLRDIRLSEIRR